ncbi:hypothetical protein SADUNF_Sadunf05G0130300 [Salix dunnii]|uniref:Uncharacterized protein n=1 Tax=Salix dunnii TaxID=1413687 RepID=A0A835K504_9ROSI|nr:hypothetical protein SADUNF_Sadunf05G0130300 [Salix dunnii]
MHDISRATVEKVGSLSLSLGAEICSIPLSIKNFHGDPCPGTAKSLLVDYKCTEEGTLGVFYISYSF